MSDANVTLLDKVQKVSARVAAGQNGKSRLWGGAGVVISTTPPEPYTGRSFYPNPLYVVTPHVRELSWLFQELGSAFSGAIDHVTKFEFYGRMAEAANRYSGSTQVVLQTLQGLLTSVLAEATELAAEFQPCVDVPAPEPVPGVTADGGA